MNKQVAVFAGVVVVLGSVLGYVSMSTSGKADAASAPPAQLSTGEKLAGAAEAFANTAATATAAAPVGGEKKYPAPPEMKIDVSKAYTATLKTSKGDIVLTLFAKEAPKTVNNFVFLAKDGFYDGVPFHRVIADFMIQGGDRNGTPPGTGGPGYKFEDEVDPAKNPHKFDRAGLLAMANAGPATNGSQFFITHKETPWLNGKHTIFGVVVDEKSQAVVNAIAKGDVLEKVTVEEK